MRIGAPAVSSFAYSSCEPTIVFMDCFPEKAPGISFPSRSRAIDALPSGKWNRYELSLKRSSDLRPRPSKPAEPLSAASSAGVVSTRLLLRPPTEEERQCSGIDLRYLEEEVLVAHLRERGALLLRAHSGHVIGILAVN